MFNTKLSIFTSLNYLQYSFKFSLYIVFIISIFSDSSILYASGVFNNSYFDLSIFKVSPCYILITLSIFIFLRKNILNFYNLKFNNNKFFFIFNFKLWFFIILKSLILQCRVKGNSLMISIF